MASDLHTRPLHAARNELPTWYRLGSRIRGASALLGFLGVVVGLLGALALPGMPAALVLALCLGGFVALTIGLGLTLYMVLESFGREAAGSRFVLGNHVVLDLGGGRYAALAHLERGSATVRRGQRVRGGEVIGRCGNSGNSSEPHVHFQVMDHPRALIAAGLPFVFARSGDESRLPRNDEVIDA